MDYGIGYAIGCAIGCAIDYDACMYTNTDMHSIDHYYCGIIMIHFI